MSASMIRLSLPLTGSVVHPARSTTMAAPLAPSVAERSVAAPPAAKTPATDPAPAMTRLVSPAWPDPASINLAGELLNLSATTMAYTATRQPPNIGADFWALLATALPGAKREAVSDPPAPIVEEASERQP